MHQNPGSDSSEDLVETSQRVREWMVSKLSEILGVQPEDINIQEEYINFDLDSLAGLSLTGDLAEWLGIELPSTLFWDFTTIESIADYIAEQLSLYKPP